MDGKLLRQLALPGSELELAGAHSNLFFQDTDTGGRFSADPAGASGAGSLLAGDKSGVWMEQQDVRGNRKTCSWKRPNGP